MDVSVQLHAPVVMGNDIRVGGGGGPKYCSVGVDICYIKKTVYDWVFVRVIRWR
jgi:hypothetical protein